MIKKRPFTLISSQHQAPRLSIDLCRIWNESYRQHYKPTDTFAVCGLNDVQNTTLDRFKAVLQAWHLDVMSANENNTFRVCKLLRPPKLAWFKSSGSPISMYI